MFFVGQWQLNAMLTCFATPVSRMSSCLIVEFSPSPASSSKNIVKNVTIIQGCTLHFGWIYGGWRDLTGRENENTKSMRNHKNITTSAAYLRQSRKEKTMLFQKIPPEIHAFWRVQVSLLLNKIHHLSPLLCELVAAEVDPRHGCAAQMWRQNSETSCVEVRLSLFLTCGIK